MGTFFVPLDVGDLQGLRFERVEALVDTGATYMRIPRSVLARLGANALEQRRFQMADGREIEYDVGQVLVRLGGRTLFTIVVFGEDGSTPLLGSVTLEEFGLGVDPLNRRLMSVPGLLM